MEDVRSKLKGTTLQVYWHLLRSGKPTSIRRLQRELGLSSPSVASYHLEKLLDMELIGKNAMGDYELRKTVSLEVMNSFVRVSQLMIPRYVFYTIFFFTLLVVFTVGYAHSLSIQGIFALAFGGSGFVRISQLMIPRYVFYTIFFFTLLVVFTVGYAHSLSIQGIFALAFGGSGFVITAYETWRQWRLKPI